MKKNIILSAILILIAFFAKAQTEKPELVTDRPDQTEAPVLVPAGGLQVETGFQIENDKNVGFKNTNFTYNTTLIKYGINENFELRFITEYLGTKSTDPERKTTQVKGFSPMAVGVKIKLADEKGIWPQAAILGHVNLRTGSSAFKPSYTAVDFRFSFNNTLTKKLSVGYNLGIEWDGETPEATYLYTLSFGYAVSSKLGVFLESYSFFPEKGKEDCRMDGGLTYKFTPLVQWDVSGGFGLSKISPDYFISTGISFRIFK